MTGSSSQPNLTTRALLAVARNSVLGRGQARRLILQWIEAVNDHPFVIDILGCPFLVHFDNETERKTIFNRYNLPELAFLRSACASPGSVFVDLGANCGYFTALLAASMGKNSTVLAIEPHPVMCERMRNNLQMLNEAQAGEIANVLIEECAIGSENVDGTLNVPQGKNGFGTAHISDDGAGVSVNIRKLTDILQKHDIGSIEALKIDIEGYEDRALQPFFDSAPRHLFPKAVVIEHTSQQLWQTDLLGTMKAAGYTVTGQTRGNMMLYFNP